jgi:peptidoglycan-associated lipoprotein
MSSWKKIARGMVAVAMVPLLVTVSGCKKKPVGVPTPPPPPPMVERKLQVSSVSPSTVNTNDSVVGKIFGSAFDEGAAVQFVGPGGSFSANQASIVDSNTISVTIPALPSAGSYDVVVTNPSGEQSTLRGGLMVRNADLPCKFTVVYFDFDRASIRADGKGLLDGAMSCIQGATGAVQISGHADERGTTDYNLALGQRRADAVKSYLTKAGVSGSRISTVSYGEERPADAGHDDGAWSRNRRAEMTASP